MRDNLEQALLIMLFLAMAHEKPNMPPSLAHNASHFVIDRDSETLFWHKPTTLYER